MPTFSIDFERDGKTYTADIDADNADIAAEYVRNNHQQLVPASDLNKPNTGYWTGTDLSQSSPYDPLSAMAKVGKFANRGNQQLASLMAEKSGEYEAKRSALAGEIPSELNVPKFLGGGSVQAGALPGLIAAGTLATASEFLLPQNRFGAAALLLEPAARGLQAAKKYIFPSVGIEKPGFFAQLGSARTKVPAGDIQQAISDPSVFSSPSVKEANIAYGEAAGPLKSAAKSLAEKTGKTILQEGDFTKAIDRAGRLLSGTELDSAGNVIDITPQDALEGIQSINRFVKNKEFTKSLDAEQFARIGQLKNGLLNYLESTGTTGMREAATNLRKAHVKENLGKFLPQNKYGSTDAARTAWSSTRLGMAGAAAAGGYPLPAAILAGEAILTSPAVLGSAIRNYHSITTPEVLGAYGAASNAAMNYLQEAYNNKKNKTPIKLAGQ